MPDKMFGLEGWQQDFVRQWDREAERRTASVPDYGDWNLYGDADDRDEDDDQ